MAYLWCAHTVATGADLCSPAVLPQWARDTLAQHEADARDALKSLQELETAHTGDAVWDAMQHQLVKYGELHNNARMTWANAIVRWSSTTRESISRAQHLNDRFALDGCDPCSHTGVLSSHGLSDRPKAKGTTPIYGALAQRQTRYMERKPGFTAQKYRDLVVDML